MHVPIGADDRIRAPSYEPPPLDEWKPCSWTEERTADGYVFYYNHETGIDVCMYKYLCVCVCVQLYLYACVIVAVHRSLAGACAYGCTYNGMYAVYFQSGGLSACVLLRVCLHEQRSADLGKRVAFQSVGIVLPLLSG